MHMHTHTQSSVTIYDLETGLKHWEKQLELQNRGVALVGHMVTVDSAHVACSVGREIQVVPCHLKLKSEYPVISFNSVDIRGHISLCRVRCNPIRLQDT